MTEAVFKRIEKEKETAIFASNLDRLMAARGMRNSTLAQAMKVSRQIVSKWRQGAIMPEAGRISGLAEILMCSVEEFSSTAIHDSPPMLSLAQWAQREGIPTNRARSLFELGVLEGSTGENGGLQLIPAHVHVPPDSKKLVRDMRRPVWIDAFRVNLDWRMRESNLYDRELGEATQVGCGAVAHWRTGKSYPLFTRLPLIAEALQCTVEDLLAMPSAQRIAEWTFRYAQPDNDEKQAA